MKHQKIEQKCLNMRLNYSFPMLIMCGLLMVTHFTSCLTAGTHGSIKAYVYNTKNEVLQKAVNKVISENDNIQKEYKTHKNFIVDITDEENDTIFTRHDSAYVEIKIKTDNGFNQYSFRYSGNEQDWKTDTISAISIAYAHDEKGNGGSNGDGQVTWYTPFLRRRLIRVFERELIFKVDKELGMKHTEE